MKQELAGLRNEVRYIKNLNNARLESRRHRGAFRIWNKRRLTVCARVSYRSILIDIDISINMDLYAILRSISHTGHTDYRYAILRSISHQR